MGGPRREGRHIYLNSLGKKISGCVFYRSKLVNGTGERYKITTEEGVVCDLPTRAFHILSELVFVRLPLTNCTTHICRLFLKYGQNILPTSRTFNDHFFFFVIDKKLFSSTTISFLNIVFLLF